MYVPQKIGQKKWLLPRYMLEMFRNLDLAFPATHFQAFTRVLSFLFCLLVRLRSVYFFGSLLLCRGENGRNSREGETNLCSVFISLIDLWSIAEY